MTSAVRRWVESYLGRGRAAPTVPPMDGALHPNAALDHCASILRLPRPDNLMISGNDLWFSSAENLYRLSSEDTAPALIHSYASNISCLATRDVQMAIGLESGEVYLSRIGMAPDDPALATLTCPTAMTFSSRLGLLVCEGSTRHAANHWQRDLMNHGASGRVVSIDTATGQQSTIASNLRYPSGIVETDGKVIVSETWAARLVHLDGGEVHTILYDLPGYPSRITPAAGGGYWLTVFAPRSQLVELVLREDTYRKRMMEEVDEQYWVAPSLSSATSYLEPLQGGAIRTHGHIKPWAPTRSYGLLVKLDDTFQPTESWHSRADGTRHGITSCAEWQGVAIITSKGGGEILRVDTETAEAG